MTTPIRAGLVAGSRLHPLVQDGIQALEGAHHGYLEAEIRVAFADSVDIDKAFQRGHEAENRWDYLLGHKESGKIVGLEPHTANNKELSVVIRKREAALRHLRDHLKPSARVTDWFWVASGTVDFIPMDKAVTRLAENGISFIGKRFLRKWLPELERRGSSRSTKRRR